MQIHGEERSDVAVTVTVHPADAIGRDLEIILEEQGETIHAEVRGPGRGDSLFGWLRGGFNRAHRDGDSHPVRSNIEAEERERGHRRLGGLEGRSACGRRAATSAPTAFGQTVTIQTASGDITAHTLNGNVRDPVRQRRCRHSNGPRARSASRPPAAMSRTRSDQRHTRCLARRAAIVRYAPPPSTSCRAKTASGDLRSTTPLAPNGEYEFSTVSGDLRSASPAGDAHDGLDEDGEWRSSPARSPRRTEGGKRNRTLAVNGGGVPVRVKSVSGDCTIRARRPATCRCPPCPR